MTTMKMKIKTSPKIKAKRNRVYSKEKMFLENHMKSMSDLKSNLMDLHFGIILMPTQRLLYLFNFISKYYKIK